MSLTKRIHPESRGSLSENTLLMPKVRGQRRVTRLVGVDRKPATLMSTCVNQGLQKNISGHVTTSNLEADVLQQERTMSGVTPVG